MTEQPDTAAIRASYNPFLDPKCVLALCDALDAARTNIERAHAHREGHALAAGEAIARAEAAEARINRVVHLLNPENDGDFQLIQMLIT